MVSRLRKHNKDKFIIGAMGQDLLLNDEELKDQDGSSSYLEESVSYDSTERHPTWAMRAREHAERTERLEREEQERRDHEYARLL